jgi:radical SAM superfamily enzyme YgiQ (UPF0313 family)
MKRGLFSYKIVLTLIDSGGGSGNMSKENKPCGTPQEKGGEAQRILLVEPAYYTKYPPLGLLKIAAYHKLQGDQVRLVRGNHLPGLFDSSSFYPDRIYITSLFTYAWREVHSAIDFYKKQYPRAEITVGGIYASLCPDHIRDSFPDIDVHQGLLHEVEDLLPDYSLVPDWDTSLIFSSRGCIRKCPFCAVRQI